MVLCNFDHRGRHSDEIASQINCPLTQQKIALSSTSTASQFSTTRDYTSKLQREFFTLGVPFKNEEYE